LGMTLSAAAMTQVPILLYHSVSESPSGAIAPFAVDPAAFAGQLDAVAESGRVALQISQYARALAAGAVPDRAVVITFDDGYADFAEHALPELLGRSLPCTLYVATGFLEGRASRVRCRPPDAMLQWSQLGELASSGVEIGAHSHSHFQLDTLRRGEAREEITRSKALLEDALQVEVPSLAYPHGYSSPTVRSLVRAAGFESAAGVKNAFSSETDDLFSLARLMIFSTTTGDELDRWLRGLGAPPTPARERVSTRVWRGYRRSRSLVTRRPGSAFRC
jgi:peptidoglycan/xylan/chitin deacetylase (PgdA/CDA1 family)